MIDQSVLCTVERRRDDVRAFGWNGLDYLEVGDDHISLCVHFIGPIPDISPAPGGLTPANFVVKGGRRVRGIKVVSISTEDPDQVDGDGCLRLIVDKPGDGSIYHLCIVAVDAEGRSNGPMPGFDPRYCCIEFTFTASCASDFDCAVDLTCPPDSRPEPSISYLAKDYGSFRTLILDRLAQLVPDWTERHVPDLGITLVELLAYVGDELSYYQDAVGTEAYLDTARLRISVRRHARLVDYHVHEGTASRAWVQIDVPAGEVALPAGAFFTTTVPGVAGRGTIASIELPAIGGVPYEAFQTVLDEGAQPMLRAAHNLIPLYMWGDELCCIPKGATSATLCDGPRKPATDPPPVVTALTALAGDGTDDGGDDNRVLNLQPGDLLLLEEIVGPDTGFGADADPAHRHVVRLTTVTKGLDELYGQPVIDIAWSNDDALPFPLCVSSIGPAPGCRLIDPVGVARGNVVLVEHGRREVDTIGPVPEPPLDDRCEALCRPADAQARSSPFRPAPLRDGPLSFSEPAQWGTAAAPASAASLLRQDPRQALPVLAVADDGHHAPPGTARSWTVRSDLLASGPDDQDVVVEIDDDRRAHLRFGDDTLGEAPKAGELFTAQYSVGGGRSGNVGANAIAHLVVDELGDARGLRPRNPLAAVGGVDPESLSDVRLLAPYTFRGVIERAVTADDYATVAARVAGASLQSAGAALRWTGSWFCADVALDTRASVINPDDLPGIVAAALDPYRRIGHDTFVELARTVPVVVALHVCVKPHFLQAHVKADLLDVFTSGVTRRGQPGFFSPDNFTFGQSVQLSRIVAAAMAVEGVDSVQVVRLERVGQPPSSEVDDGTLVIGPMEIARLDNDRSFPEQGQLLIELGGGR